MAANSQLIIFHAQHKLLYDMLSCLVENVSDKSYLCQRCNFAFAESKINESYCFCHIHPRIELM